MNLQALVNPYITAVNPNFVGVLQQSAGYVYAGDAAFTGSITGPTLTVSALATGTLAVNSIVSGLDVLPGTMITALGSGQGGPGTYTVSLSQTAASSAMTANGSGQRIPVLNTATGVPMQFQDLTSDELRQVDGLNISTVMQSVYLNGAIEGIDRAGVKGGDLLLAPTGRTSAQMDTWLVVKVFEAFYSGGWTKVGVTLQQPGQAQ